MKPTLLVSTLIILGVAFSASAQKNEEVPHPAKRAAAAKAVAPAHPRQMSQVRTPSNASVQHFHPNAVSQSRSRATVPQSDRHVNRLQATQTNVHRGQAQTRAEVATNAKTSARIQRESNRQTTTTFAARGAQGRNVTIVNNWRGARFNNPNYVAFRNYHREWHDRGWWRNHYSRVIFLGPDWGWWAWSGGYWYPAWGYEVGFNYPYYGPIYSYGDLTPSQVVLNVQQQLADQGYYSGPIDGDLGPMTRRAIAAFQVDHGLVITSTIDRPTLATLGLV